MKLRNPTPPKVEPGRYIVAWRGRAQVLLITRKLPGRYFFRDERRAENFVTPEEVLACFNTMGAAEMRAAQVNEAVDLCECEQRRARMNLADVLGSIGLKFDL